MASFAARVLILFAVLALGAAGPALAQTRPVAPILTTPDAVDDQSYARPREARVTHVDLDLETDFAAKTIRGTATLDVLAQPDAKEVVLDALDLKIAKVTDASGRPLKWRMGPKDGEKGSPLAIELAGAKRIVIAYEAAPDASALQWLPPELTAGKKKPFLYSQGQAILNRSWFPTQDSPGVRQTWSARLVVPEGLTAVMSAERLTPKGEPAGPGKRAFRFRMDHPVPTYLVALAVGDLSFRPLGARTGVYTEPAMLDRAARELADTEKMVETAEALYGPYRWGRYDVLVLPPAFPYGGMENATLTFLTPTFITGDRANVSLVAHELAHSWSGNLVTNATWPDVWLNEGFTSYVENRIMEAIYGRERAVMEADLAWDSLQADIAELGGPTSPQTRLYGGPGGQLDYTKGEAFLRTLETLVGRARWDAYLRGYFDRHAFRPQTTAGFLADLREHLVKGDAALEARLMLDSWAYAPGIPANAVHVPSPRLQAVDRSVTAFAGGAAAASLPTKAWTTQEWQRFLNNLPRQLPAARLADLDRAFGLSNSPNGYIRSAWLELAIANRYEPALPGLRAFLTGVGRGLFVRPLYQELMRQGEWGQGLARRYFAEARATYHPSLAEGIARLLGGPDVQLYAMDCGKLALADADAFADDGAYKGVAKTLVVPCYLVRHPDGDLVWDTGLPQGIADRPGGAGPGGMTVTRKLTDQLAQLGLKPSDIEFLSVSHSHFDHIGNAGLFAGATWIVDPKERAHAFRPAQRADAAEFARYAALETAKTVLIEGEGPHDVFGDGSVLVVRAPGHTPGHTVLLVNLAQAGPVLLTGDMWHIAESQAARRVPRFNFDRAETLRSMQKVEDLARERGARIVRQHVPEDFAALPRFPEPLR